MLTVINMSEGIYLFERRARFLSKQKDFQGIFMKTLGSQAKVYEIAKDS